MTRLKRIAIAATFLLAALLLAGCAATPTPAPTPTPTPVPQAPKVVSYSVQGEELIAPTEPLVIEFDQAMDVESMLKAFEITPQVEGSLTWQSDHTLKFAPTGVGFARDTEYVVTIGTEAHSKAGKSLTEPVEIRFHTAGYIKITDVQPSDGTREVDSDTVVAVMFSRV